MFTLPALLYLKLLPLFGQCLYHLIVPNKSRPSHATYLDPRQPAYPSGYGWKEALLEDIDADDLPAYLGGNRTDPDGNPLCETFVSILLHLFLFPKRNGFNRSDPDGNPLCETFVSILLHLLLFPKRNSFNRSDPDGNPLCETFILRGQPVPKSYYMQKRNKSLSLESNVERLTVMPFSKEKITFEVTEENSFLEWEFETKSRDIDFSLLFSGESPVDSELVELIPKQRIDTSDEPEKGCFKCEKVGRYTIVFDNSYSWFHSKEVYCRAGIKNPRNNELYEST
ncbi:hypothetical protein AVEN_265792-1 [Araneus ventricosus]|uniref:GOLD domain-containing protein n=1 Tax=Araneus ventricosus TaxID=182803 RepID=A0A4Y2MU88_ARAVE|nr:hypothetical protein AVEN_265792-1 [Araneus ventricosus]